MLYVVPQTQRDLWEFNLCLKILVSNQSSQSIQDYQKIKFWSTNFQLKSKIQYILDSSYMKSFQATKILISLQQVNTHSILEALLIKKKISKHF